MTRRAMTLIAVVALVAAACGGAEEAANQDSTQGTEQVASDSLDGSSGDTGDTGNMESGSSGTGTMENPTPEASGSLPANSIRIGDEVWQRTLPMTSGQCFLYEDDGTLPDSGTAWGTLNNDEELSYSANYNQDGSFEAQVRSNFMFWMSGQRDGTELTIELDFPTQTISGEGLFYNGHTNEWAYGSFQFTCEEE